MALALYRPSFSAGEVSPSLWGRLDIDKVRNGASVMRNFFVSYRGGASSRAGLMFVGQSLQPASESSIPPRIIQFQYNLYQSYILEFGDQYMRVIANGAYLTETPLTITGVTQANPAAVTIAAHGWSNGDWVYIDNVDGMTELNGRSFIIANVTMNTFTLRSTFDNPINSLPYDAYTSGGTAARIYTNRQSPYAADDLPYLKVVQSADVMSLCCVNQQTNVEYEPYDLKRLAANNWDFDQLVFEASIDPPASVTAVATVTTGGTATQYAYCITSIDRDTGDESIASPIAYVTNSVNIATTAGSLKINWSPVAGASKYNIYKAPPSYGQSVPIGSVFGYAGTSYGTEFVDSNITQDMTITPPLHLDPFARGAAIGVTMTAAGSGYVQATTTAAISGGTGAVLAPVVISGSIVAVIIENGGSGYIDGQSVVFADSSGGAGAVGTLEVGPQSGTYPSVVGYFQQRRCYAATLNNPDTYFFSQTGAYLNFDAGSVPIDSDAITGTPWGAQVNSVQWLQPMPGGLLVATGKDVWQLSGTSGAGSLISPSSQSAASQESNGFSPTVKPLKINSDILYVGSIGSIAYDVQYNFNNNIYGGTDISVLSNHLFEGYNIEQWAFARQPFKIVWATRNDGKFLSLTFLKEQEIVAWARHDTNGLVVGNETATEPPVDAPYFIVKRYIVGEQQWAYYIERMDNRLWNGPENVWCVDAGLSLYQPAPDATLSASAAGGPGTITGGYIAIGGSGYTAPTAQIIDPSGTGSGGEVSFTLTSGEITGFSFVAGSGYSPGTYVNIIDATGGGATFIPFISQNVFFTASSPVFGSAQIGDVIRMDGGSAVVTAINSSLQVVASIVGRLLQTIPNDPNMLPVPAGPGDWTITTPVSTLTNLHHLEGMQVSCLADGVVIAGGIEPLLTVINGTVTLPVPASSVVIGLPYTAQLQSLYFEPQGAPTQQGKRKKVVAASFRLEKSRGVQVGVDQPVASALDFQEEITWTNLQDLPDFANLNVPGSALPLFTGDKKAPLMGSWENYDGYQPSPAFVAVQQTNPLPVNVLALVPDLEFGDTNG
jgi:hypothetical protein